MKPLSNNARMFLDCISKMHCHMPFTSSKDTYVRKAAINQCLKIIEVAINGQDYPKSADIALEILNHYTNQEKRALFVQMYNWLRFEGDFEVKASVLWELYLKIQESLEVGKLFYSQEADVYSHLRD